MKPKLTFPISIDAALRRWLPKVKRCDRWKSFRAFARFGLSEEAAVATALKSRWTPPKLEEYLEKPIGTEREFLWIHNNFLVWRAQEKSRVRSEAGSAGGKARRREARVE